MAKFDIALSLTLKNEGGYVNDLSDSGLATNFGISLKFYKKKIKVDATSEDIKNLSVMEASDIYKRYFWDPQQYEFINSQKIADKVFDLAVNTGPTHANSFLQKAVNIVLPEAHLVIDGALGHKSFEAINFCDEESLYVHFLLEAQKYYDQITARDPKLVVFKQGWHNRLFA